MSQNIIDVSWDLAKFDLQTQAVLKNLTSVYDLANKAGGSSIPPGSTGGYTELKNNAQQFNVIQENTLRLTKLQEEAEQAKLRTDKMRSASVQKLTQEQKLQNTITESAVGSYKQLDAQLKLLLIQYKNLSDAERKSPVGKAMGESIVKTNNHLKKFDKDMGNHQRNVGNYTSALDKLSEGFGNVFRRVMEYASIYAVIDFFKGMVTSAMDAEKATARFQATLENIGRGDVFERLSAKAEAFTKKFEYLNKHEVLGVFEQLIQYGKLTENQINDLIPVITNFAAKQRISIEEATPMIVKALEGNARAMKQYGVEVKDTHSVTERLGRVMDQLGPKVEGAAEAFGKTTQGKIAKTKEDFVQLKEEIGTGLLPVINQLLTGLDGLINKFSHMHSDIDLSTSAFGRMWNKLQSFLPKTSPGDALQADLAKKMARKFGGKQVDDPLMAGAIFTQPEDTNPEGKKILGLGGDDKDKTLNPKKAAIIKESLKESLDLEFEIYKISQQRKLKLLDEEANDTKRSFSERMSFAEDYYNASKELAEREAQHEINIDKIKLKELESNLKTAKGTDRNNLLIDIENEKKQIIIATAKKNDSIIGINEAFAKRQEAITKDELSRQLAVLNEAEKSVKNVNANEKGAIEASHAATMASLDTLLKEKKIKQDFYDEEKAKSIKNMEVLQLQSDLRQMESTKAIMILKHEDIKLISSQIEKQKSLIVSAQNKPETDDKKKKKNGEYIKQAAQSGQDLATGLVDIKYQKELDAIQKIIDLNNYRKDQEMANINASTLSNQEKAAQMIILDKTVAANNHKLAREKVALEIKQAKFDRDMAILSILENAAIAAFKMMGAHPLIGIAEGIAVEVAAAASIAMILAKPLPQMPAYGEGTENHPGGPAIVGEKRVNGRYQKELVTTPDGKAFVTSGPMLMNNLPKGSRVLKMTSDFIMDGMTQGANMSMAERIVASNNVQADGNRVELSAIKEAIENGSRMTVQAMKKQRGANVNIKVDGYWGAYITKSVKE